MGCCQRAESQRPEGGLRRNANGGGKNGCEGDGGRRSRRRKRRPAGVVVEVLELPLLGAADMKTENRGEALVADQESKRRGVDVVDR